MVRPALRIVSLFVAGWALAGCNGPAALRANADRLAASGGLNKSVLHGEAFTLVTYSRLSRGQVLTVYIEGDGQAYWLNQFTPSPDPTPSRPMGLILALRDNALNLSYIGRPCQFVEGDRNCKPSNPDPWTIARFSPQAVESIDRAIDALAHRSAATGVALVGYSGGGTIAALLAERRHDVVSLTTIASPLDTAAWTQRLKLAPLTQSLNPAEGAGRLSRLPQRHFQGAEDDIVPAQTVERFVTAAGRCAAVYQISGFSHEEGWVEQWSELRNRTFGC